MKFDFAPIKINCVARARHIIIEFQLCNFWMFSILTDQKASENFSPDLLIRTLHKFNPLLKFPTKILNLKSSQSVKIHSSAKNGPFIYQIFHTKNSFVNKYFQNIIFTKFWALIVAKVLISTKNNRYSCVVKIK